MTEAVYSNRLQTPKKVKHLTDDYYKWVTQSAQEGKKVAWCTGPVQHAPLRAMGIPYIHMHNYAARLAGRRVATKFFDEGERWGLSREACSY